MTRDAGGIKNQDPAGPNAHNYFPSWNLVT